MPHINYIKSSKCRKRSGKLAEGEGSWRMLTTSNPANAESNPFLTNIWKIPHLNNKHKIFRLFFVKLYYLEPRDGIYKKKFYLRSENTNLKKRLKIFLTTIGNAMNQKNHFWFKILFYWSTTFFLSTKHKMGRRQHSNQKATLH